MVWESQKLLGGEAIVVNRQLSIDGGARTGIVGNSLARHSETRQKPGVELLGEAGYPSAVSEGGVFVDRLREDIRHPRGLDPWVVADNVRKGAALNSVQIAEIFLNP